MKHVTGPRELFARRLAERGVSWQAAGACVVAESSDTVTVDVDHPAYPRLASGSELWAEIHRRPLVYVGDDAAELAWLRGVVNRLPGGCDCRGHWSAYLDHHPPRLSSPAVYALWTFDAHTAVNLRLGKSKIMLGEAVRMHCWYRLDLTSDDRYDANGNQRCN